MKSSTTAEKPMVVFIRYEGGSFDQTPKGGIRIPLSAFRHARQFSTRLVTEMLAAANGAKDGPGHHLDGLLRSWVKAECDLEKWAMANPNEFYALRKTCEEWRVTPFESLVPSPGRYKPVLTGAIGLDASAEPRDHAEERVAYDTFAAFVLTSSKVRIGICDRAKCRKLYWTDRRPLNKRFCGRKCSQLQTAKEGQAKRLAKERREKNKRIRQALTAYVEQKPAKTDWKVWVTSRARVTQSYLTRALHKGLRGERDGLKLTKAQIQYLESKGETRHANLQARIH